MFCKYVNRFAAFNNYASASDIVCKDDLYMFPFNMNTSSKIWGSRTVSEA